MDSKRNQPDRRRPAEPEIRAELARILASPAFAPQDRLQKFLVFVVERTLEGRGEELKETNLGFDVFERPAGYDSRTDPVVRMQARRLRDKLDEYYASAAPKTGVRISMPKGGYVPEFAFENSAVPAPAAAEPPLPAVSEPPLPAEPVVESSGRRRFFYFGLGACAAIAALVILGSNSNRMSAPGLARIRPFAGGHGYYRHPAFSPDGRQIAFDWDGPDNGNTHIYLKGVDSDASRRLTSGPADESRPVWSPDGKEIAFLRELPENRALIVIVPAAGAGERTVSEIATGGAIQRLDWSPDGATFLTSSPPLPGLPIHALILISAATGSQRAFSTPPMGTPGDSDAAFSPDGSMIAFRRGKATAVEDIYLVPAKGGDPQRLTTDGSGISGLAWARDSNSIVFGSRRTGDAYALWRVSLRGGAPVRLTETIGGAAWPNVAARGGRIAFSLQTDDENIWEWDVDGQHPPEPVITSDWSDMNPSVSPDGAWLAFRSSRSGASEIWVTDIHGASPRKLTHFEGAQCGSPDWSPDGRAIAFDARVHGAPHVYVISPNGGATQRLTSDEANEVVPHWTRDSSAVYYASNASGQYEIWKKALHGGAPVQVTRHGGYSAQETLDGRMLYFSKGPVQAGLWRMPVAGGPETLATPQLRGGIWGTWRVARDGVYFLDFAWDQKPLMEKLYFHDFATGQTHLRAQTPGVAALFNAGLALSPDERAVFFVQIDHWGTSIYLAEGLSW